MQYYLYKITNTVNGKIYIGIHSTSLTNDTYMGSGKLIKAAIKKYGVENFRKDILEQFTTEAAMVQREIDVVTEEFVADSQTYNIMPGGRFGSAARNGLSFRGKTHSIETVEKIRFAASGRTHTESTRQKMSVNNFSKVNPAQQKAHAARAGSYIKSVEHRKKISDAIMLVQQAISPNLGKIREKVVCPHCEKQGSANTMYRWHFTNCKFIGGKSIGADPTL